MDTRRTKGLAIRAAGEELPVSEYLDTTQAAALLGFTRRVLEHGRSRGGGPPFCRVDRHVRYTVVDLRAFMAERKVRNTCEELQRPLVRLDEGDLS